MPFVVQARLSGRSRLMHNTEEVSPTGEWILVHPDGGVSITRKGKKRPFKSGFELAGCYWRPRTWYEVISEAVESRNEAQELANSYEAKRKDLVRQRKAWWTARTITGENGHAKDGR